MKVRAKFFATFGDLFGGRNRDLELPEGRTVGDVLAVLCDTPARSREIFEKGGLRPHLIVMVNGIHLNSLAGLETVLADGDTIAVFPMLGGG